MGSSLFDQLQKSGLVDEKKAKKARQEQHKGRKQKTKKGAPAAVTESQLLAQKARADKVARDRQLNQQKKEQQERKAITAQIRQLIENNAVKGADGDIAYHFNDANVVKSLYVSAAVHKSLSAGRLLIVRLDQAYEMVPWQVAEKIRQRDEHCVIQPVPASEPVLDDEDPYADYQIPDDLMW